MHNNQKYPGSPSQPLDNMDYDLITRCQNGDRTAFDQLIQCYQDRVFTYVYQLLGDAKLARETTLNTFVSAYRLISRFQGEMSLKAWIFKITEQHVHSASHHREPWYISILPNRYRKQSSAETDQEAVPLWNAENPDCKNIRALLSEYIDGELSEHESKRVQKHLRRCAQCHQEFQEFMETVELVQSFGIIPAPSDLRTQINTKIDAIKPFWKKLSAGWFGSPSVTTVIVASIAVFLLGIVYYNQAQVGQSAAVFSRDTVRGETTRGKLAKDTFMLVTGKLVSKEMLLQDPELKSENLGYDPENAEFKFVDVHPEDLYQEIGQKIQAVNGKIIEERLIRKNTLTIRSMLVEIPQSSDVVFFSLLQHLNQLPDEQHLSSDIPTVPLHIYLIDKQ